MANPASMAVTPGSGAYVATNTISEGGQDRHIQRTTPSTGEGEDVSIGSTAQIDVTINRPATTTVYTAEDALSNDVTTPTAGGYAFANASRASGKSGLITDLLVFGSAAQSTQLQGELWLFDSIVTNIADNAAFALNITDLRKLVAILPFTLKPAGGGVSYAEVTNVSKGYVTVGSTNLYGLVKVKNAYTPVSSEQITFRLKTMRTN